MKYRDYIQKLSNKISARLQFVESIYNFEKGDEFEIAICQLLMDILPQKYGVCRGFVVSEDNKAAGDDIIIYDKTGYPTLRSSIGRDFSLKEEIPIEAVYAYIECKHTISEETLLKGMDQVKNVKELLLKRESVVNEGYDEQKEKLKEDWPIVYPRLKNQPFGVLLSKGTEPGFDKQYFKRLEIPFEECFPDLIVAGNNLVMTPTRLLGPDGYKTSLFNNPENSIPLLAESLNEKGFGVGIVTLMFALEWIQLNPINWRGLLEEPFWE